MNSILDSITPALMWIIGMAELILGVLIIVKNKKELGILMSVLSFGLAIDAVIQALGVFIGGGEVLQTLSQGRFILHGILVPLLIPIAFLGYGIKKKITKIIVYVLTCFAIVLGVYMGIATRITPEYFAGVLRYAQDKAATPEFAQIINTVLSTGGVVPLIVLGIMDVIKNKTPYLMISGLLMLIFSALAPAVGLMSYNFVLTMIGEALLMLFFYFEIIFGQTNKLKQH